MKHPGMALLRVGILFIANYAQADTVVITADRMVDATLRLYEQVIGD